MEAQFVGMKLQIGYLRSREDSERVRAACVTYLQTSLSPCRWFLAAAVRRSEFPPRRVRAA